MTPPDMPRETLDRIGLDAYPAFVESEDAVLRYRASGGLNFRNSSVTVLDPAALDAATLTARATAFCAAEGIAPVLRLVGTQEDLSEALRVRGWEPFRDCIVMTRPGDPSANPDPSGDLVGMSRAAWIDLQLRHKDTYAAAAAFFRQVIERSDTRAQTVALRGDPPLASALLHREANWIGLMNMLVSPEARGQGLGRRLLSRILGLGCEGFWLQVYAGNRAAVDLYRSAGFEESYPYTYWRPA